MQMLPSWVNLTALEIRLTKICRRRDLSLTINWCCQCTLTDIAKFFSVTWLPNSRATSITKCAQSNSSISNSVQPLSILDKSRISLISSRFLPFWKMRPTMSFCWVFSSCWCWRSNNEAIAIVWVDAGQIAEIQGCWYRNARVILPALAKISRTTSCIGCPNYVRNCIQQAIVLPIAIAHTPWRLCYFRYIQGCLGLRKVRSGCDQREMVVAIVSQTTFLVCYQRESVQNLSYHPLNRRAVALLILTVRVHQKFLYSKCIEVVISLPLSRGGQWDNSVKLWKHWERIGRDRVLLALPHKFIL